MEEKLFDLVSEYKPTGDQPEAIDKLVEGLQDGKRQQVLLGATGTGKTFTIANVIQRVNKPTLVFAHNKTLAGQLYSEFKALFPNNAVEYFISNFDYYQPEAYMPKTDTYIEKNAVTNDEIDKIVKNHDGDVYDMDSAALGQVCYLNGIPYIIVGSVSTPDAPADATAEIVEKIVGTH